MNRIKNTIGLAYWKAFLWPHICWYKYLNHLMEQICKICRANGKKLGQKSFSRGFNYYDIMSLLPEL